jgi:hypothetical protein
MLSFFLTSLLSLGALAAPTGLLCNGNTALCSRSYSNITFIGSHDSAFVGSLPTQNQKLSVTDQLNSGIRFLQAQTHSFLGTVSLCHTSCLEVGRRGCHSLANTSQEDSGTLSSYLTQVKTWLDANPQDLITVLLTNPDAIAMPTFASVFQSVGLDKYAFTPPGSPTPLPMDQWPLLGDMIASNTRLVVFIGTYPATQRSSLTASRLRREPKRRFLVAGRVQLLLGDAVRHDRPRFC